MFTMTSASDTRVSIPTAIATAAAIAVRASEGEGAVQYVTLRQLRLDELNARTKEPTEQELDELADLILAQGLLQNLIVIERWPHLFEHDLQMDKWSRSVQAACLIAGSNAK